MLSRKLQVEVYAGIVFWLIFFYKSSTALGRAVGIQLSQWRASIWIPALALDFKLLLMQMQSYIFGFLPPMWDTWMELLVPGFGLAQSWMLYTSGELVSGQKVSLSLSLSLLFSSYQTNKKIFLRRLKWKEAAETALKKKQKGKGMAFCNSRSSCG